MRPQPNQKVLEWFKRPMDDGIYTSSITQAEIQAGIALLPAGKRLATVAQAAEGMFKETLNKPPNAISSDAHTAIKQLSLAATDFVKKPKQTLREKLLIEMEAVVPGRVFSR